MKNKLKIAAIVAVVAIGMIVYKQVFDKRQAEKGDVEDDSDDTSN